MSVFIVPRSLWLLVMKCWTQTVNTLADLKAFLCMDELKESTEPLQLWINDL